MFCENLARVVAPLLSENEDETEEVHQISQLLSRQFYGLP